MPVRNEITVAEETQLEEQLLDMREGQDHLAEEQAAEADRGMEIRRFDDLAVAMKMIMEGEAEALEIEALESLSPQERAALDLLGEVVRGRHHDGNKFYAEYRLASLNSLLAVVQPILAVATLPGYEALRDTYYEIVDMVNDLRDTLDEVDSAEEEKLGLLVEEEEGEDEDDEDDDDEDDDQDQAGEEGEGEAAAAASGELSDDLAADRRRRGARRPAGGPGSDDEPAGG